MHNQTDLKLSEPEMARWQAALFPYAYNLIGETMPAEDIVQEVLTGFFLKSNREEIANVNGYLIRATINKAINYKNLLRQRKESYPGQWLPEPVLTESAIYEQADRKKLLDYSLLVLLENLNPHERAVFILKEAFELPHDEIADVLSIQTDHSRQLLKRAREKLRGKTRPDNSGRRQELLAKLRAAIARRDMEALKSILARDVSAVSDGGGKRPSARNILYGETTVAKFLMGIWSKLPLEFRPVTLNHQHAMCVFYQGALRSCFMLDIADDKIEKVYIITHPDKLPHV